MWWRRRQEGEETASYLARVLEEAGLTGMAEDARAFHYDDYRCPPDVDDGMNMHRLVGELRANMRVADRARRGRIDAIAAAAMNGEFDGTRAEAAAWETSPDGQEAMRALFEGR
jgi:hypothetical protein